MKLWIIIGLLFCFAFLPAGWHGTKAQVTESFHDFSLLRQNDEINISDDSDNFYHSLKRIELGSNTTLSFGGSWRFQYESFINEQFQHTTDQDNLWYLNRLMLHAHLKVNDEFETFAELTNSLVGDKVNVSPVDKDALSVNQLFIGYKPFQNWRVDNGRKNIRLGSGRLVDIREGPNVRRSFDLASLTYGSDVFSATAFFSIPVQPKPNVFDNDFLKFEETFTALYTSTKFNTNSTLDAYLFYQKDNNVAYNNLEGDERRYSIGVRHHGNFKSLIFNNEAVFQFGSMEQQNISAWTLSFQLENETPILAKDYNVGLKAEIISGDKHKNDNQLNTFDALYPRGAYFGRVARFGPSNLFDIHPYINTSLGNFFIEVDYDAFWRHSTSDGVYNPALLLEYPDTNDQRFIGQQVGSIVGYQLNKHIAFELENNIIFPGPFLKQSDQGDTLYHFVFTTEMKF
jgi:hypothetical protein